MFQPGGATGNFLDTIGWSGIQSVTENGVALSSFSVNSSSGTDWTQDFVTPATAVPEPPSFYFVGSAIGLVLLRRRMRQMLART